MRYIAQTTNSQELSRPSPLCSISSRILSSSIVFASLTLDARDFLSLQSVVKDKVKDDHVADDWS